MEKGNFNRYAPLKTAPKKAGYKVDEVEKQGKRTVIAVSEYEERWIWRILRQRIQRRKLLPSLKSGGPIGAGN
jgi:hypothetical protein